MPGQSSLHPIVTEYDEDMWILTRRKGGRTVVQVTERWEINQWGKDSLVMVARSLTRWCVP